MALRSQVDLRRVVDAWQRLDSAPAGAKLVALADQGTLHVLAKDQAVATQVEASAPRLAAELNQATKRDLVRSIRVVVADEATALLADVLWVAFDRIQELEFQLQRAEP